MKKLLSLILSIAMILSVSVQVINADEDTEFEEFMIMNFDRNGDGVLSDDELTFNDEYAFVRIMSEGGRRMPLNEVICRLNFGDNVKSIQMIADNVSIYDLSSLFYLADDADRSLLLDISNGDIREIDDNYDYVPAGEISLILGNNVRINGDLSKYSDYNIVSLHVKEVQGEQDTTAKWFTGAHLKELSIEGTYYSEDDFYGDISTLVKTATNLDTATLPSDLARVIPTAAPLKYVTIEDTTDSKFTNTDFSSFISNHSGLTSLSLACPQVNDLSPIQNGTITSINYSLRGYSYNYDNSIRECLFVDGKPLGDHVLEQLVTIPSLQEIEMNCINVTDLTPCSGVNKTFDISGSWVADDYKNNAAIKKSLTNSNIMGFNAYNYPDDVVENYKDKKLNVKVTSNKKEFKPGETVTYSVEVTNIGSQAVDVNLYNYLENCAVVNGDMKPSIKALAPGKSVKKSITVSYNDDYYTYITGTAVIDVDGKIIGAKGYPYARQSESVDLYDTGFIKKGDQLYISGTCSLDTKTIKILTSDNELLATINNDGKTSFNQAINVPEKYLPADGETSKTLAIKAEATDADNETTTSNTIYVEILNSSDEVELEDCNYMSTGTTTMNSNPNSPGLLFSGGKIIVRAKFSDDITGANLILNNNSYPMTQYTDGMFKGYYHAMANGITDSDFFNIMLEVTTKSGKTLKMFGGYGRVLIDPSGIISDPDGNPIEGVKVTLQKLDEDGETWADWDAENYMQQNPVYTNDIGYYGWDVVEGTYRIVAEKEGFVKKTVEKYTSRDMGGAETAITVLPPRFDVDFTLEYADPENPPIRLMNTNSAKTSVESELAKINFPADTEGEDVLKALNANLSDNIQLSFKSGTYAKTPSSENEKGSITGTIIVENISTDEMEEVEVNIPLAQINEKPDPSATPGATPSATPGATPSATPGTTPSASPTAKPEGIEIVSYNKDTKTAIITSQEELQNAVVIFVSYDEHDRLIGISVKDISATVTADDSFQNGIKVKVLVWKSLETPEPLAKAKEF